MFKGQLGILKLGIVALALSLFLTFKLYAYDDGDFQVWNTEAEEFKINQDAKIVLEQEFRRGGQAKELYYQHYDLGFFYNLQKNFNVGAGYRHVLSKSSKNKFLIENEPYLSATLFWDLAGFKIDDRSRLES
ncbi:MAG: hypothetical protein COV73_05495 [Candidatus Omnitrophica bacterium CG11_big_fil_rev_8_21_14_0_20_43_6]|nr:MAG: hypothetical protein COV73_05495 [Candidatus Omnitrophica bacterium CG11_big_fil_rev_8_21_14_0_20_43_6]